MKNYTAQKMKFSIKNFFSKCDQIRCLLRIWLHLQRKSLMENFIFSAVLLLRISEVHLRPCQTYVMAISFAKIVNS